MAFRNETPIKNDMQQTTNVQQGYVKLGDIEGEATDSKHEGWSILHRFCVPIVRTTGGYQQRERAVGSTGLGDAIVVKDVDSASVKIQKACATGQLLPKVQVNLCTTENGTSQVYLSYEFENVIIVGYDLQDMVGSEQLYVCERVSLSYNKVTWTYVKFDKSGKSQGKVTDSYTVGSKS